MRCEKFAVEKDTLKGSQKYHTEVTREEIFIETTARSLSQDKKIRQTNSTNTNTKEMTAQRQTGRPLQPQKPRSQSNITSS